MTDGIIEQLTDNLKMSNAELFARVVLGYKWDGKEFGKC